MLLLAWTWASLAVLLPTTAAATTVRMVTVLGPVDIELYDAQAPQTVANFLGYVRRGDYDNMFFHRLVKGFVLQGGGFAVPSYGPIPTAPPVVNEFSSARSNLRGKVAMAKLPDLPDSATSQWFVNLANNSGNLDNQNGGFTVFGRVRAPGMVVVDAIAALRVVNAGGSFNTLPILQLPASGTLGAADLVVVSSARELPVGAGTPDHVRIFNYLEAAYPQFAAPASQPEQQWEGYTYRYYPRTNAYAGVRDGRVWYLVPALGPEIGTLGTVADWLAVAAAAGY